MFQKKLKILTGVFLLCNLLFIVCFLIDLLFFRNYHASLSLENCRSLGIDPQEIYGRMSKKEHRIIIISEIIGAIVCIINLNGIKILLRGQQYKNKHAGPFISYLGSLVPPMWKIPIPLFGFLLFVLCYRCISDHTDYLHLYMELLPGIYFSLVALALLFVAIKNLKKQQ